MVVLGCCTITIAMALLVGWQWAKQQAKVEPADVVVVQPADIHALALTTPVLSVRRAPGVLSRRLNITSFRDQLFPLLDGLNDTSCVAVSVDGQLMAERNADLAVIPASTMKLITAAVAVEVLGRDRVFTTRVTGTIGEEADVGVAGAVIGDLFLVGGGDPLLGTDWWSASGLQQHPPFHVTRLEQLADAVVAKGVTRVTGSVVGDGSRYDDEWFPPSWDASLHKVEAGPIDGLLVNDARDAALDPTHVADDPALGAATLFTTMLQERGVQIDGFPRSGDTTSQTELASVTSRPLSDIVEEMLRTSDDNTAEMLLKEIGLERRGLGTREAGLAIVQSTLEVWGIPLDGVVLVDGSGLSNDDRLTCRTLLALLQLGHIDDVVGEGLPVAGESGTLIDAFLDSPIVGRMHAKTGTLNNADNTTPTSDPPAVKALAGYVEPAGGGAIEFVLILNGQTVTNPGEFGPVWYEQLGPALASYPAGASTDDLGPR
jgi:serine-type D-Ala-D-Ala carboxypeptidase/endopeptidase (penicillin-binding protein 4)